MENKLDIDKLIEIIIEEISLDGIDGTSFKRLFTLLKSHEDTLSINLDDEMYKNFIIKIVTSHENIDFYTLESNNKSTLKHINSNGIRGYSSTYEKRVCVNDRIRNMRPVSFVEIEKEFGSSSLIFVANQQLRENAISPSHKCLKYEQLNDTEYGILEEIAKSRTHGTCTTGDHSLSKKFKLEPKQLHYVLSVLERHDFIVKKSTTSAKNRYVVYLRKFEQKSGTNLDLVLDYLLKECEAHECQTSKIRNHLNLSTKQLKNIMALGEQKCVLQRYTTQVLATSDTRREFNDEDEDDDDEDMDFEERPKRAQKSKYHLVRMLRLTPKFIQENMIKNEIFNENDDEEDGVNVNQDDLSAVGSQIDNGLPLIHSIFKYIEKCGKDGVALRKLGHLFGLDFYKSRRLGAQLQSHPEIVTLVKETERNRAKYQTIVMRKFLAVEKQAKKEEIKLKNGLTQSPFQAVVSERAERRRLIILDYLTQRKICTKVEVDREIRKIEEADKLKGVLDAKTSKRILVKLESEGLINMFEMRVKNQIIFAVKLPQISETSQEYLSFMNGYSRTIDFASVKRIEPEAQEAQSQETLSFQEGTEDEYRLTREYQKSIVSQLDFSYSYAKCYGLVTKFQKALILHRFIHYLLYFYDGAQREETPCDDFEYTECVNTKQSSLKMDFTLEKSILDSARPSSCYQTQVSWKMFVPPISFKSRLPLNCLFIGDLMSNIPISVYASVVGVNFKIPGLLSILKHPFKRHMLFRDLPNTIIAALIHERRYLQKVLYNLQLLASLGLITFVQDESKHHQPMNRSLQTQMIYVHRQAAFRDTTKNSHEDWSEVTSFDTNDYDCIHFNFDSNEWVLAYWQRLLHVSMNTYKFNVSSGLKESKKLRSALQRATCKQIKIAQVQDLKPLVGDHRGPGGYDTQLFLNSISNWVLPTNIGKQQSLHNLIDYLQTNSKSDFAYSELAMPLPLHLYRSLPRKRSKSTTKCKTNGITHEKISRKKIKIDGNLKNRHIKLNLAKQLVLRARSFLHKKKSKPQLNDLKKDLLDQKRATWSKEEDDMIVLIKIASLYLIPSEISIQFKLVHDLMKEFMPETSNTKKTKSFGRRMKLLCNTKSIRMLINNQLESLKHNKMFTAKYSLIKLKRTSDLSEQAKVFVDFIRDMIDIKKKNSFESDVPENFVMPKTKDDLLKMYSIQSGTNIFKNDHQMSQPKSVNDISFYSLQSAIHSSILINDKTPRDYESSKLFEQYSDEMLNKVIITMSNQHCIIAPTKCSEMRRKEIISVSKHIGKAYHISQRYQYKWSKDASHNLIEDVNLFNEQMMNSNELNCTDRDSQGMTAYIAHNLNNQNLNAHIELPNKIWVSKFM